MLRQPGVGGGCAGDRLLERPPSRGHVLADGDAVAPLCDKRVGDAARPVASPHGADLDRPGQAVGSEQRRARIAGDGGVKRCGRRRSRAGRSDVRRPRVRNAAALGLQPAERSQQRHELLDGVHTLLAHAAVGGQTVHHESEHQRSGLRRHHVEPGGLHHDGAVGSVPPQKRRQGAGTAVLLADHAGHAQTATQPDAGLADRPRSVERAAEAAFHVDGAATVDPALPDGRVPRRRRPGGLVADRHDVDVTVEEKVAAGAAVFGGRAGRPLAGPADHTERCVTLHLVAPVGMTRAARPGRSARRRSRVPPRSIQVATRRCAAVSSPSRLGSAIRSRKKATRPSRSRASSALRSARLSSPPTAAAAQSGSRRTGRVRQVGPPSALNDSGSPGKRHDLAVSRLAAVASSRGCHRA